jgi:hypothetical protein
LVLQKTLTNIVQISILIPVKKIILKEKQKVFVLKPKEKEQKDIKPKEKETELSSQILFSYPSDLPNGFSLISSRREVKSKTTSGVTTGGIHRQNKHDRYTDSR